MKPDKLLAIITVVHNNYTVLDDFLSSLSKQSDNGFLIYIVDNSDNAMSHILPRYAVRIPSKNKGYAAAVNIGIKQAINDGYSRFCVINSDTSVSQTFVQNVNTSLEKHSGSLIGGKIYYEKGFEFHYGRYKTEELGHVLWYAGGICDWKNALTKHRGVDEVDHGQYNIESKTDFITGCLLVFDKKTYETIGPWDESFFLYYEDADYCERAKHKHIQLWYDPSLIIWHKNAGSTGGSGSSIHQKFQKRNQLTFGLRYAPFRTKLHLLKNYFF